MIGISIFADTLGSIAVHRVSTSWPWYVVRGAGFVAAGLLILLMLSGIGQVTGLTYRFFEPIKAWAIHKALAYGLLFSILVHVSFLLIDKYIPFSLTQVLVPFASTYNNKSTVFGLHLGVLGVAAGIIAAYFIVMIVASSLKWIDTKKRVWRNLHFFSYAGALLVLIHAALVGSDLRYGAFRNLWFLIGGLVGLAVLSRVWRARTLLRRESSAPKP